MKAIGLEELVEGVLRALASRPARWSAQRLTGSKGELGQGVEYRSAQTSSGEGPEMLNPEHVITGWLVR